MCSTCSRRQFLGSTAGFAVTALAMKNATAAPLPNQLPPQGLPPNQIVLIPDIQAWLQKNPKVRDAIVWQTSNGSMANYASWNAGSKANLATAFAKAYAGKPSGLPETMPNIYPKADLAGTTVTPEMAWQYFLAHVGQSLAVELRKDVAWSITTMSAKELAILFDSRQFFDLDNANGGYSMNFDISGNISFAPPDLVWAFLKANQIPKKSEKLASNLIVSTSALRIESISQLLLWCSAKLQHGPGGFGATDRYTLWQYAGAPPVARMIKGTFTTMKYFTDQLWHFTAGCHGTVGFLRAVCRVMNIAVEYHNIAHAQAYFIADKRWLAHGDDAYGALSNQTSAIVGNALSYPMHELLINQTTYDAWFGPNVSPEQFSNNFGRRQVDLAYKHIPFALCYQHYLDLLYNKTIAEGSVFKILSEQGYTIAQLLSYNLWGKIESKIEAAGGVKGLQLISAKLSALKHS
jgi:hypothetical protein